MIGGGPSNSQNDVVLRIVLDDGTGVNVGGSPGTSGGSGSRPGSPGSGNPSPAGQNLPGSPTAIPDSFLAGAAAAVRAGTLASDRLLANNDLRVIVPRPGTDKDSGDGKSQSGYDSIAEADEQRREGPTGEGFVAAVPAIERLVAALDRNTAAVRVGGSAGDSAAAAAKPTATESTATAGQAKGADNSSQSGPSPTSTTSSLSSSIVAGVSQAGTLAARVTAAGEGVGGSTAAGLAAVSEAAVGVASKLGPLGVAIAATVGSIAALGYAANQTANRLSQYSPEISAAQSVGEARTMMADVRAAKNENLTSGLAEMTEKLTDINLGITETGRRLVDSLMPFIAGTLEAVKMLIEILRFITSLIQFIIERLIDIVKVVNPVEWAKAFINYWYGIEQEKVKQESGDFVNDMERFITGQTNVMPDVVGQEEGFLAPLQKAVDEGREGWNKTMGTFD